VNDENIVGSRATSEIKAHVIHTSNPSSASSRSNQREYPVASMPTRTQIPRCCRSR